MEQAIYKNNIQLFETLLHKNKYENKYELIEKIIVSEPEQKTSDFKKEFYFNLYDIDSRKSMIDLVVDYNEIKNAFLDINPPITIINQNKNDTVENMMIKIDYPKDPQSDNFKIHNTKQIYILASALSDSIKDHERSKYMNQLTLRIYVLKPQNNEAKDIFSKIILNNIIVGQKKPVLNLFSEFFLNYVSILDDSENLIKIKLMNFILESVMESKDQRFMLNDYLLFQRILSLIPPYDGLLKFIVYACLKVDETDHKAHWYFYLLIKQILEHPNRPKQIHTEIIDCFYLSVIYMYMYVSFHSKKDLKQKYGYFRVLNRLLLTTITSNPDIIQVIKFVSDLELSINDLQLDYPAQTIATFYVLDFSDYEKPIKKKLFERKEFKNTFGRQPPKKNKKNKKNVSKKPPSGSVDKYNSYGFFNIYLPHDQNNYAIQMASKIGDHRFLRFLIELRNQNPYIDPTCDQTNIPLVNVIDGIQRITVDRIETSDDIDYWKCLKILMKHGNVSIPVEYQELLNPNTMIENENIDQ